MPTGLGTGVQTEQSPVPSLNFLVYILCSFYIGKGRSNNTIYCAVFIAGRGEATILEVSGVKFFCHVGNEIRRYKRW